MKKRISIVLSVITAVVMLAACGGTQASPEVGAGTPPTSDAVEGLTLDQYDGLEVSLVQLDRMMPVAGNAVNLTFNVTNNGDKVIAFVQGSSSNPIPSALTFTTVNAEQYLGIDEEGGVAIATMDYVVKQLLPGESMNFTAQFIVSSGQNDVSAFFAYAILEGTEDFLVDVIPTAYAVATWSAEVE